MDELVGIRQRKKQRENESMAAPLKVGGAMAAPPPAPSSSASSTSAVARVAPLGPPPAICTGVGGAGTGRARSPPPTPKVAHVLLVDLGGTNARFDLRKVSVHVLVARLRKRLRTPRSAAAAAAASSASANPTPYGKRGAGSGEGEEDDEEDEQVCAVTYPTVEEKERANELVDGRGSRFEGMISRFLAEDGVGGIKPDLCVAGVCGPVMDGAAYCASQRMMETTGPWHFDEASVSTAAGGCRVVLLNDFVAVGHALETIKPSQMHQLYGGAAAEGRAGGAMADPGQPPTTTDSAASTLRGTIACLGPGTGLGNVYAVRDGGTGRRKVMASEGCMTYFVARTKLQWDFCEYIRSTEGYVPVDRVVSGQGIASWYTFLGHTDVGKAHFHVAIANGDTSYGNDHALGASGREALGPTREVDEEFNGCDQPAGVVARHGTVGTAEADPLCVFAIDCFLDTLGQEAANLAMRFLARGGVYIAGGGELWGSTSSTPMYIPSDRRLHRPPSIDHRTPRTLLPQASRRRWSSAFATAGCCVRTLSRAARERSSRVALFLCQMRSIWEWQGRRPWHERCCWMSTARHSTYRRDVPFGSKPRALSTRRQLGTPINFRMCRRRSRPEELKPTYAEGLRGGLRGAHARRRCAAVCTAERGGSVRES